MKRRDFLKTTAVGTVGTLFISSFLGCTDSETLKISLNEHFKQFQNPLDHARLFVRWWWNGNRRYLFHTSDSLVGIRRRPPFLIKLIQSLQLHPVG